MSVYLVIAIVVGLFSLVEIFNLIGKDANKKIHKLFFALFTLFAIFFVGFRACGFDYDSYANLFEDFQMPGWRENADINMIEYGYAYLNHLLGNYYLVLITMALFTITLQFTFIYKYSPYPFLTVFLILGVMLYPSIMGQYRQALAIGIVLWAFVDRKNKVRFLILIFLASIFHATAIICLVVYFVPDKYFKSLIYFLILGVGFVLNFGLKAFVISIAALLPALMSEKVDIYSSTEDYVLGLNMAMIVRILIIIIFLVNKKKIESYPNNALYFNIYFLSVFIYLAFGALPQIALRGGVYFFYLEFLLVAILVYQSKAFMRYVYLLFFMALSIWRQIGFFVEWSDDYIPYVNILFS
jgi:hypothetical protein